MAKIPLDIRALLSAAFDIEKAKATPVSVNVLIDETVSPDFQAFIRAGFNSQAAHSRVMMSYFPTQTPDTSLKTDITVIAAGSSDEITVLAQTFRHVGSAVLVVAESAEQIRFCAQASGVALPEKDLVVPQGSINDEEVQARLADHIGMWIVETDREKSLAFSLAYPFVRRPLAQHIIVRTAIQNAGVGVVVFVPGADMPVMTLNQAKMVLQIAAAYGYPLEPERVKELAGVLAGALVCRGVARQAVAVVPALGWAIKGAMGYAVTTAIGKAALEYFEQGGNIAGLAAVVGSTRDALIKAGMFIADVPGFQKAKEAVGPSARKAADVVKTKVAPTAISAVKQAVNAVRR